MIAMIQTITLMILASSRISMGVHFLFTLDSFLSDFWTSEVMIFATMKSTTATIADTIAWLRAEA